VGGEDSYVIQMSQYLGINKDSKNKEAARCSQLLRYHPNGGRDPPNQ